MAKKILIIDESALFREYLAKKFGEKDFEVVEAKNGLDGMIKMRNELPDLVLMDYFLSRKGSLEILKEKMGNPNVEKVPVVMVSNKIDKENILQIAKFGVKKFFTKPIKIDSLLKTISSILHVEVEMDDTPCIIEAHFNDEILFIEIARGLNKEKIELLKYKLTELLDLYEVQTPKVLIMMSNLELTTDDSSKVSFLFEMVVEHGNTKPKYVKVLTTSIFVREFLAASTDYSDIEVKTNLTEAMDELIGIKPDSYAHDDVVRDKILSQSAPKKQGQESIELRFEVERSETAAGGEGRKISMAVVDDDIVIQELLKTVFSETGWEITIFNNGKEFTQALGDNDFDLVYLDLMMPEMNGFQVLQYLKENNIETPVIVFSALSRKETVVKAVNFGIHSYMIKPLKPEQLLKKAAEAINSNF